MSPYGRVAGDFQVDEEIGVLGELGTPPFIHPVAGFGDLSMVYSYAFDFVCPHYSLYYYYYNLCPRTFAM
jgi:hypothetical protein